MNGQPIRTEINNGVLSSTKAMPMKDITSDNQQSFSMNRLLFFKAYQPKVNFAIKQVSKSTVQRESPGIHPAAIIDGPKTVFQKKWMVGNRDASSVAARKRTNTTGITGTATGPTSFKNTTDTTTRTDALTRVRGAGSRVPPKVVNRPALYSWSPISPMYYRIIAAGLAAVSSSLVNVPGNSAFGVSPGFYKTPTSSITGSPIATLNTTIAVANTVTSNAFGRSYNVLTIHRSTGITTVKCYDVFGSNLSVTTSMTNDLNALTSDYIVVIATFDEPENMNGTLALPAGLITAVKRCGGSSDFASSPSGIINYRSAYLLVGVPGIGTDKGLQRYVGIDNGTGDPLAAIDVRISVLQGNYTYISG